MVSPLVHKFKFLDDRMAELAALCGERGVPIISQRLERGRQHRRVRHPGEEVPAHELHPGAHGSSPADMEASAAAADMDNFFLETSLGNFMHIQETVKKAGASKVIFGSEYPLSHPAVELKKVLLLEITEREREKILGENIRDLMRLESA